MAVTMIPEVAFLHALAQALAATSLYAPAHPARRRAVEVVYQRLRVLQAEDAQPCFSFLGRDVIFGQAPLRELRDWEWAGRCAAAGVQRIEVLRDATADEVEAFVDDVQARLAAGHGTEPAAPRQTAIRFGPVGVQTAMSDMDPERAATVAAGVRELLSASVAYTLREEADAVRYLHGESARTNSIPLVDAEAVVRSLSVALHADGRLMIPLLRLKAFDQYTTTHSINVSILVMALAEALGHVPRDVRALGIAGLLHDLGKVRVPPAILTKPGALSPDEREILDRHPAEGARLILNSDRQLTLQAAVAFEHHIWIDGGGYPRRRFNRDCHYASTLVHICDVFDALRTDRPYRPAWTSVQALEYIERRSGKEFDPEMAEAFASLMRKRERSVVTVDEETTLVAATV
jgi:HD-GYP domain-containing protein (c-di-GMP phosphodiesterase class II)